MQISKRAGIGLAVACLMGSMMAKPAFADDKVSLFKVITTRDEIVIGLADDELKTMDGNAGGIAKALVQRARSASGNMRCARRPPGIWSRRRCAGSA